uniref:Uncharacterized protein n=1 Tax=viral metagenome TaxID=1070528 RepID=A0A6H1ZC81_9ZZZZ
MKVQEHLKLLGVRVEDKVTGHRGVVESIAFDLYGCIQAVVIPPVDKDGKKQIGDWFDIGRLKVIGKKPVMECPNFNAINSPIANGKKGPAEKPI